MIARPYRPRTLVALSFAALVVCSIPVFGSRYLNDMDFYSLFADKLLSGGALYRDAMDTKPPFVFLHYALVFKVFGPNNVTAVKIVTMAWLGLSAAVMVWLRRSLAPGVATPVLAAPLFILASFSGWGEEFLSSNTELLANLFILVGIGQLASRDFSYRPRSLVAGGVCVGIAFLYRYQSGAALAAYAATILLRHRDFDRKVVRMLLVGGGFALPSIIFVAYYARLGALADLRLMLALQAHYARDADAFHLATLVARMLVVVSGLWPVLILAGWQSIAILRNRATASRSEVFQLMFAAWSASTFFVGGRLFPHYFVQAIPGLVLLATDRLDPSRPDARASAKPRPAAIESWALAMIVTMAAVFTAINGTYYWTRKGSAPTRDVVSFVESHSRPDDEVLLWTWRPHVLFETGRVFATRLLVNSPLIGQLEPPPGTGGPRTRRPGLPELWPAYLRDLSAKPPRIIIDDIPGRSEWRMERYPQLAALLAGYHDCHVTDELCLYVRKD